MAESNSSMPTIRPKFLSHPPQVDKLLNPKDGNVTIKTLHKAAAVVGKRFEYKLV